MDQHAPDKREVASSNEDGQGTQSKKYTTLQASRTLSHLPNEELDKLVDDYLNLEDRQPGTFIADDGQTADGNKKRDIDRQIFKAALVKGYVSNELVAVDISNRIDFEYGNMGPEVNPNQQLINNGKLFAENEDAVLGTEKQRDYRSKIKFRSMGPVMLEQCEALERDDDVHSVSEVSLLGINGFSRSHNDRPCSIDCPLKMQLKNFPDKLSTLLDLDQFEADDSAVAEAESQRSQVYEALQPGYMRTLELQAGSFGDPVQIKLQTVPVNNVVDPPDSATTPRVGYEALSYTWGKPFPQFPISCNGAKFLVGRSLFFALQHLRRPNKSSTFWIDAVCIDQSNALERSEQVQQMLRIYQGAESVVVWLGEESEDSHYAIETMKHLDNSREERHGIWDRGHTPECIAVLDRIRQAHASLFARPWFLRSWIRQEISAAKDVVVHCGRDSLGWYSLKRSCGRLPDLRKKLHNDPEVKLEFAAMESNLDHLIRGWIQGQRLIGLIGFIGSMWYFHSGGLLELLMTGREFDATDPRDKIYSVLGLAGVPMTTDPYPDETSNFPVDYTKSVSEVYQDAVKYFINRDRNLDIISILLSHRNEKSTDLPSWAPDWRVPVSEIPLNHNWDFFSWKMAAGGYKVQAPLQSYSEVGILRVQGYFITTIKQCDDVTTGLYELLQPIIDAQAAEDSPDEKEPRSKGIHVRDFDASKHTTRCCRTENNNLCLAPASAQPDDAVVILIGGKTMFLLRWVENEDSESKEIRARVVGPCIVPALMFGAGITYARSNGYEPTDIILV